MADGSSIEWTEATWNPSTGCDRISAGCDNCYAACPEDAIIKLGPGQRYKYDYAKCTGCAVCFDVCPCHAIEMIAEPA